MNHFPQAWGRASSSARIPQNVIANLQKPRDDVYGPYDSSYLQTSMPQTHTQSPAVTGTSVLGVKFKDGVVVAADNLGRNCRPDTSGLYVANAPIQLHTDP